MGQISKCASLGNIIANLASQLKASKSQVEGLTEALKAAHKQHQDVLKATQKEHQDVLEVMQKNMRKSVTSCEKSVERLPCIAAGSWNRSAETIIY